MLRFLAVAGLAMTAILPVAALAQDATLYTATYVELVPTAKNPGSAALRAYRDASKADTTRLDVVQRLHWPS